CSSNTAEVSQPGIDTQTPVIVFVCEHGSAKSIVAAAHFNDRAIREGVNVRAISRGTNPDERIAPAAENGLRSDGIEAGSQAPTRFSKQDVSGAWRIVAFCPLPEDMVGSAAVEDWSDVPPISDDYGRARDAIVTHIERLLDELKPAAIPGSGAILTKVDAFD